MGIVKEIEVEEGKKIPFKTSGAIPLIYRLATRRDIMADMVHLKDSMDKAKKGKETLAINDFSLFEDIAYCMAKHADGTIPDKLEWFEQFDTFSIYRVLPEIFDLWKLGEQKTVESKKKFRQQQEK